MRDDGFPELTRLMAAWFNQEFGLQGETVDDTLADFAGSSRGETITGTVAELDRLLISSTGGLLSRFEAAVGGPDITIADDDEGARAWLQHARERLSYQGENSTFS